MKTPQGLQNHRGYPIKVKAFITGENEEQRFEEIGVVVEKDSKVATCFVLVKPGQKFRPRIEATPDSATFADLIVDGIHRSSWHAPKSVRTPFNATMDHALYQEPPHSKNKAGGLKYSSFQPTRRDTTRDMAWRPDSGHAPSAVGTIIIELFKKINPTGEVVVHAYDSDEESFQPAATDEAPGHAVRAGNLYEHREWYLKNRRIPQGITIPLEVEFINRKKFHPSSRQYLSYAPPGNHELLFTFIFHLRPETQAVQLRGQLAPLYLRPRNEQQAAPVDFSQEPPANFSQQPVPSASPAVRHRQDRGFIKPEPREDRGFGMDDDDLMVQGDGLTDPYTGLPLQSRRRTASFANSVSSTEHRRSSAGPYADTPQTYNDSRGTKRKLADVDFDDDEEAARRRDVVGENYEKAESQNATLQEKLRRLKEAKAARAAKDAALEAAVAAAAKSKEEENARMEAEIAALENEGLDLDDDYHTGTEETVRENTIPAEMVNNGEDFTF